VWNSANALPAPPLPISVAVAMPPLEK
jgi:hypothetical protein